MKISVITPTVRPEMLTIIMKCLQRQTFSDFEWLIVTPYSLEWKPLLKEFHFRDGYSTNVIKLGENETYLILEPPKKKGDYYGLNKGYNEAFKHAKGELIVSIQDGLWFAPDLLQKFWDNYQVNPKAVIGAIGNQFDESLTTQVWQDPRQRSDLGSFYETLPSEIEYTVCAIPHQAIIDVKGLKEEWDKYAALSEKEMNYRMQAKGYKMYLDQSQVYKAIHHERLSPDWDKRYWAGEKYFKECIHNILQGKDLYGDLDGS